MSALAIQDLTLHYRNGETSVPALKDVSFELQPGELAVVAGPSGAGKSSLLRAIAGFEIPDQGRVWLEGKDLTQAPPEDRGMALVFQENAVFPHFTIRQNLEAGLAWRGMPAGERQRRVQAVAERFGLEPLLNRLPNEVSGGERRRTALARAWALEPRLLLLDEPFAGLDAPLRAALRGELLTFQRRTHCTLLLVTHDPQDAMALDARVLILNEGRLQQSAPVREIYHRPASRFIGGFFGQPPMNFFNGTLQGNAGSASFRFAEGYALTGIQLPDVQMISGENRPCLLGVRPEHLRQVGPDQGIAGRVEQLEWRGTDAIAWCRGTRSRFAVRLDPNTRLRCGDSTGWLPDLGHLHYFEPETGLAWPQVPS